MDVGSEGEAVMSERAPWDVMLLAGGSGRRPLTERQQTCLTCIEEHIANFGRPPTLRWIGARMGIHSTNGVIDHLRALERKGYIRRDPFATCGIVVIKASGEKPIEMGNTCPLCNGTGRVA